MKTAISIPDEIFEKAERTAKKLGVSRSELYTKAIRDFVERYRRENLTEKLNEIYFTDESISELDPCLMALQTQSLKREDW
jgi:metal-responsive CopG/Arc/MetJ family transcriptional regulator